MIIPVDVTPAQLCSMTKTQIINRLSNWLTNNYNKRQLILWLMDAEELTLEPVRTFRADGQIESETVISTDMESGGQVRKTVTTWSYYPTGEVDTITQAEYTGKDALKQRRNIKHYKDGRQPTVTEG